MRFVLIFVLVVLFDRLSKSLVLYFLDPAESVAVVPGIFYLTRVQNTGAAFGLLKNAQFFLSAAGIVFLGFLFFGLVPAWRRQRQSDPSACLGGSLMCEVSWALIGSGAFGNLVDRFLYGSVIDFLDFRVWPVFNLADTCICLGAGLLIMDYFMVKRKTV